MVTPRMIAMAVGICVLGAAQTHAADCPFRYNEAFRQNVVLPTINAHQADRADKFDIANPNIIRDGQHVRLAFEPKDGGFGGMQDFLIVVDACTLAVIEAHDDTPSSVASEPAAKPGQ